MALDVIRTVTQVAQPASKCVHSLLANYLSLSLHLLRTYPLAHLPICLLTT